MKLSRISYKQNLNSPGINPWILEDTHFNDLSLIIGSNSTGKSRLIRIISSLRDLIFKKAKIMHAEWIAYFVKENNNYEYHCFIKDGIIEKEVIKLNDEIKLFREGSKAQIYSEKTNEMIEIAPPENEIVFHVRRDKDEYPFFEDIYEWAENSIMYKSVINPHNIQIGGSNERSPLPALESFVEHLGELGEKDISSVIDDLNFLGFGIEKVSRSPIKKALSHLPFINTKILYIQEKGLKFPIPQMELSEGMLTSLALLISIKYITNKKQKSDVSIFIDDLGTSLDYERSSRLAKLLKKKVKDNNIQIIATTNDQFLANAMDLEDVVLLKRDKNTVSSYDFKNNKSLFEEFEMSGMDNYNLLSSDFFKK